MGADTLKEVNPTITTLDISEIEPSAENALKYFPPDYIGPSWAKNEDGSWLLPEHTLGWEIAGWCAEWLRSPDGGPWRFTPEQLRLLLHVYSINEDGSWKYRKIFLQRLKGWG